MRGLLRILFVALLVAIILSIVRGIRIGMGGGRK
jgi:hypothetical protein